MTSYFLRAIRLIHKDSGTLIATIIECKPEDSDQLEYLAETGRAGHLIGRLYPSIQGAVTFAAKKAHISQDQIKMD